ncbi:MAG: DNA recombination/repair protein RecA [Anaerolineales bacterium]|nr:DNA recombination/repair protein RecA [Anaerolineales bacterium]
MTSMENPEDQSRGPASLPSQVPAWETIPSGSLRLDAALGIGGLARGQFVEISGGESSGKTTLCQHIIAEAQKLGGLCAFIDADHSLDPAYAASCGVDPEKLYLAEPQHAEQALDILETLAQAGEMAVIVLDSLTALTPRRELQISLGKGAADRSQELLARSLRRLSAVIRRKRAVLIFTSRVEQNISAAYHDLSANPDRLALKLHAGQRLALETVDFIRENGEISGIQVQVRVIKNKFAPSLHTIKLDIMYNNGIRKAGEIFDLGLQSGVLENLEGACVFQGTQLGAGRESVIHHLLQNPRLSANIEQVIRQRMFPMATSVPAKGRDDCTES